MSLKAQSFLNPNNRVEFKVCVLISEIVAVGMGSGAVCRWCQVCLFVWFDNSWKRKCLFAVQIVKGLYSRINNENWNDGDSKSDEWRIGFLEFIRMTTMLRPNSLHFDGLWTQKVGIPGKHTEIFPFNSGKGSSCLLMKTVTKIENFSKNKRNFKGLLKALKIEWLWNWMEMSKTTKFLEKDLKLQKYIKKFWKIK